MKNSPMKRIVLCADDYAQSPAISTGILQLVEQRRLSAVSCLSESEFWASTGHSLSAYRDRVDIGLHFNLTHAFATAIVPAQTLPTVMRSALSGRIDRARIATALRAQLDSFEAVMGDMPDFVDGHQHVHVLPVIRDIVVAELERRYAQRKPYLRAVNPHLPGHGGFVKLLILKLLGRGFSNLARRHGLQTNSGFAGIYSLQPQADFATLMQRWLQSAHNGDLLMCHPGIAAADDFDPIAATRPLELALLQSDVFAALLARNSVCLSRFGDIDR